MKTIWSVAYKHSIPIEFIESCIKNNRLSEVEEKNGEIYVDESEIYQLFYGGDF